MFVSICVLTSLVSQSLGLLIGAGLSVESGVFLGPVSSIPTVLFSGFFVTFDTIPDYLKWLTWASYSRYGFEGMFSYLIFWFYSCFLLLLLDDLLTSFSFFFCVSGAMVAIYGDRERLKCSEMYCHYRDPKKILEQLSMHKSEYWLDAVALVSIFLGLRVIAYFVLRWKIYSIR